MTNSTKLFVAKLLLVLLGFVMLTVRVPWIMAVGGALVFFGIFEPLISNVLTQRQVERDGTDRTDRTDRMGRTGRTGEANDMKNYTININETIEWARTLSESSWDETTEKLVDIILQYGDHGHNCSSHERHKYGELGDSCDCGWSDLYYTLREAKKNRSVLRPRSSEVVTNSPTLRLSEQDTELFLSKLSSPGEPNPALIEALQQHTKLVREDLTQ